MTINVTLADSTGQRWQFKSDRGMDTDAGSVSGFGLEDGTSDVVDNGFVILVNGTGVNPQNASVDEGGREINTAPVLIDGVAVSRSVRVSDTIGFARFLDSFTNTTDQAVTITVETLVNSGADTALQFPFTTSGDTVLDATDTGYVTDDANTNGGDSALTVHYGDGTLPATATSVTSGGGFNDLITVTHTLTLQPGETQSLLQFGAQNFSASEGNSDLTVLNNPNVFTLNPELLTGLSDAERASVVNYANVAPPPSATLVDSDGNRWNINQFGQLSSLDTNALVRFDISVFPTSYDTLVSFSQDAANDEVTIVRTGLEAVPNSTVTYTYRALPDQGLIRLLVTWQSVTGGIGNTTLDPTVMTGANPTLVPVQFFEDAFGKVSGVVLDDSESGTGGTLPALTYVFGATGADNTSGATGNFFATVMPGEGIGAGETRQYLFFFALNDTGLDALADLARLNTPGPQELIGLSAAEVAGLRNFDLDNTDRLQTTLGTAEDDDLIGNAWGDSIRGGIGDDNIAAGGSDDRVLGDGGEDNIDGGDGNDVLSGGTEDDVITGGAGDDVANGNADRDHLNGQGGDDDLRGDEGNDALVGGSGRDSLFGGEQNDDLFGNTGTDRLEGGNGFDRLFGGAQQDTLFGGNDGDDLSGGGGDDRLTGDAGIDVLSGGSGNDTLFGGTETDFLTGGDGADDLFGGEGDDDLRGDQATEPGINRMFGGQGGDTYTIRTTDDRVSEVANGTGTDMVFSQITYKLTDHVEQLFLVGPGNLNGTGNALDNQITGNANNNTLNGGAGVDTLQGGNGNDTYVVDNTADVVIENAGAGTGTDTVNASATYTLSDNVERLTLTGNAAINGTGNALANRITGNSAANSLAGREGNDILTGGAGVDRFVFNTSLDSLSNVDTIMDFAAGEKIRLDNDVFTSLASGTLAAGRFINGTVALDANDFLLYDIATGILRYDQDGNGANESVRIAIMDNNFALSAADFVVF